MPSRTEARRWASYSESGSDSGYSDISYHTQSTAPTVYSDGRRPSLKRYETDALPYIGNPWAAAPDDEEVDPRLSVETYASTVPSEEDLDEEAEDFQVPDYDEERFETTAIPSSPPDFAKYFPSTRRMNIRHDDSTMDGNMNLRVDTEIRASHGHRKDLTLFHLRMHDLRSREFSLRRYCRDSGREVCHSSRKYSKPAAARRPGFQRSMSHALTFRSKSDTKTMTNTSLKRHDSGYESLFEEDMVVEASKPMSTSHSSPLPTNSIHMEFSNYAHLDVSRRGVKGSKRYEFEYWGTNYTWKRVVRRTGTGKETSFHLVNPETSHTIAHIVPAALTVAELNDEEAKGGWVPPCSLWISDEKVLQGLTDVAE